MQRGAAIKLPDFTMTAEIEGLALKIVETLEAMDKVGDLDLILKLRKTGRISSIHSSVAIEANTLSLQEVTDIINGKRVLGNPREIQEVKNAWEAYEEIGRYDPYSIADFLAAHERMSSKLVQESGQFRSIMVGVYKGFQLIHEGAKPAEIKGLMQDVFDWGAKSNAHPLIKSSVFHYLIEYVHPFEDGNGRMGRLWQNVILTDWYPVFQWIPIETLVYQNQQGYYDALASSEQNDDAAIFVEFMLKIISFTLQAIIQSKAMPKYQSGKAVALPYLPVFPDKYKNFPDKRLKYPDIAAEYSDKSGKTPRGSDNPGHPDRPDRPDHPGNPDSPDHPANPDNPANPDSLTTQIPDYFTQQLTRSEKGFLFAIFPYLCEHGAINNYRAQTLTDKSADSVRKYLAKLVQIGFLQPVGQNKARVYQFADFESGL